MSELGVTECSVDRIAENLGAHPCTFHRRLRDEGRTFDAIEGRSAARLGVVISFDNHCTVRSDRGRIGYSEPAAHIVIS